MRLKSKVYLYAAKSSWEDKWSLSVSDWEADESDEKLLLETRELWFDLPSDWDPTGKQVQALQAQLTKLRATATAKETEIVGKINQLLCLEMRHD